MVKQEEFIRKDGVKLIRYYSDEGYKIIQNETGEIYEEAVDIENAGYTYNETEEKINETEETIIELINNIEIDTTINPSNM